MRQRIQNVLLVVHLQNIVVSPQQVKKKSGVAKLSLIQSSWRHGYVSKVLTNSPSFLNLMTTAIEVKEMCFGRRHTTFFPNHSTATTVSGRHVFRTTDKIAFTSIVCRWQQKSE